VKMLQMMIMLALRILVRHRLRAGLTMLGVIIGVGSVIAMVSIGQGAASLMQERISSLGSNVIMIFRGYSSVRGVRKVRSTLTISDAEALLREVPGLSAVAYTKRGDMQVIHERRNWSTRISGVTPSYFEVRNWPLSAGTPITQAHLDTGAKVAVLGNTVVQNLFESGVNPIGATLRLNKMPFTVIGTLSPKGSSAWGNDQDDRILIPFTTAERKVLGTKELGSVGAIFASAKNYDELPQVVEEIENVLREQHALHDDEDDDFYLRTQMDIAKTRQASADAMMILLFAVASISLLVGGIGIMNTLLVSVTERTREIGIRIAVGAKRHQVMAQFLVESSVLSMVGGVIGIGVGITAAKVITALAGWPTIVSPWVVIFSFLFSVTIGILFGLYPASKASKVNPIDALRYE